MRLEQDTNFLKVKSSLGGLLTLNNQTFETRLGLVQRSNVRSMIQWRIWTTAFLGRQKVSGPGAHDAQQPMFGIHFGFVQ